MYEPKDENMFEVVGRDSCKWKDLYPDAQENFPSNFPETLGKYVVIRVSVNENHAENM